MPQMTRLFLRTTTDGVALRGYLQQVNMGIEDKLVCDANSWCPPPECNPTSYFIAELSNEEAVSQNGSASFPLDGPAASRGETALGQQEGAPVSSYMVQTNDEVTNVRGTWPDGVVDEMAPVDGWAVVAHSGAASASALEVVLGDGSTVALKDFGPGSSASYPAQCTPPPPPPPELPPAGEEQPADVAAASQAVTDVYLTVFTHGSDPDRNETLIEDGPALRPLNDKAKENFGQARETITVEVGEIRFLSATEAALYYELKYEGAMLLGRQVGYAKFIDGQWKVARDTMCSLLSSAGAECDPPPDPARSGRSSGSVPVTGN
jgi:hypothetical protein